MDLKRIGLNAMMIAAVIPAVITFTSCGGGESHKGDAQPQSSHSQSSHAPKSSKSQKSKFKGLFKVDGRANYFNSDGELQKDGIVGSDEEGYYYADKNGLIDLSFCTHLNIDGVDWNIINGKAEKVVSDSDKMLNQALKVVEKCTDAKMSRDEKLRKCFDYIKTSYLEGELHTPPYTGTDWPVIYAGDIFIYGKGDCFSYGAAYAYMGKAIGCREVYACNSGGHGWAEIDGKFYDPEWDKHHNEYNHFAVKPDDKCDVNYTTSLIDGADWMRVKL